MRISGLRISNFRCFTSDFSVTFQDMTALIGHSDVGKSSVLDALDIFFENRKLDQGDRSSSGDTDVITIACVFEPLSRVVVDSSVWVDLSEQHLLRADGQLELVKTYDASLRSPRVKGIYALANHPTAEGVSDLISLSIQDLRSRAQSLGVDLSGVDQRVNSAIRSRIWGSTADLQLSPQLVTLEAEGTRQTWRSLQDHLPLFSRFQSDRAGTDQDHEAQDPMKVAVKEAVAYERERLGEIADSVRTRVAEVAELTVQHLTHLSPELGLRLIPDIAPAKWEAGFKVSLNDQTGVPLNKHGSGVRRLVLLSFLRARADIDLQDRESPYSVIAVEEPETSQHPSQQRHLLATLCELSEAPEQQVILTTHSPSLARLLPLACIRFLTKDHGERRVAIADVNGEDVFPRIVNSLGLLGPSGMRVFIGVEGWNDVSFLSEASRLLHIEDDSIPDLMQQQDDGAVFFLPGGGAPTLAKLSSGLAELTSIPEFYLFDRDAPPGEDSRNQALVDEINDDGRDWRRALLTSKLEIENYLHSDAILASLGVRVEVSDAESVPKLVAEALHTSQSEVNWADLTEGNQKRKVSSAKKRLCRRTVRSMTLAMFQERDPEGELVGFLRSLGTYL